MKKVIRVQIDKEFDIAFVGVNVPVRYDEEDMPNDYPFRLGKTWDVLINADTGQIQGWPESYKEPLDLHMKVVDGGTYTLLNKDRQIIASVDQDYVPHGVIPGSYGDYIEFRIDGKGKILNWPKNFDLCEFFRED